MVSIDFSQISGFFQELAQSLISHPNFEAIGVLIVTIWSAIPSAKSVPVEFFSLALVSAGVSPLFLIIGATLGAVLSDYILYLLGRGTFRLFKGKQKEVARAEHLLHKYRLFIFFFTPFLGIIGDAVLFVSGLERVGFRRIWYILIAGHFTRFTIGMYIIINAIQVPEFLNLV